MSGRLLAVAFFQNPYDNVPIREQLTWEQLAEKLTTHRERQEKGGMLWSPTQYPEGVTRKLEHVQHVSCLVLDMDSGIVPDSFIGHWRPYAFAIHSSHSSTAFAVKWRAVFPLATPVPAARWPIVWPKLALVLGLGHVDPVCKDATRLYFLPTCPVGDREHFAFTREGEWLDEATFPDPPEEKPRAVNGAPVIREEGRVAPSYLAQRALEKMQREGRNAGAFWLACQMRDNGFSEVEALEGLQREYLPACPDTNAKGKVEPFTDAEVERAVRNAYSRPGREEWKGSSRPEAADPTRLDAIRERVLGKAPADAEEVPPADVEPPEPSEAEVLQSYGIVRIPRDAGDPAEPPALDDFSDVYTLRDSQQRDIPPIEWIVAGLLCEGLNLLSGNPKGGKSYLSLGTAIAVALGGKVLSSIDVSLCRVLYIAVEDGERRIKSRASYMLADEAEWPSNVHIAHKWPMMTAPGLVRLRAWFQRYPDTKLVIIDTWNGVRPAHRAHGDLVKEEYDALTRLKEIGDEFHAAILVIHHMAQRTKEDSIYQAAGTHAMAAVPDVVINFHKKGDNEAELEVQPRDEEKHNWLVKRDERTSFWLLQGETEVVEAKRNRLAIYELLEENGPMKPKAIAGSLCLSLPTAQSLCQRMARDGELNHEDYGRYSARRRPGGREDLFGEGQR
jgi:hypothetical protein